MAPGNPGVRAKAEAVDVSVNDVHRLVRLAVERAVDLVVVGPEAPLVDGLADALAERRIPVLGPKREASRLEGSKSFAKRIMDEAGVPTARWGVFREAASAIAFARSLEGGAVVKADGLAAGKGVIVARDLAEAESAIASMLSGAFGAAGAAIVVEEKLQGEELSVIALTDGKEISVLAPAQDHKRVFDDDQGPNTGGMGAYSPAPRGTPQLLEEVEARILRPVVRAMERRGTPFSGVLYAGLMLTDAGPRVLEFNVRFGDPEAEAILPRLEEDAYLLFRSVALGDLRSTKLRFSERAAVTVVLAAEGYPGNPRRGDRIEGLSTAEALEGVLIFHAGTRAVGSDVVTAGGRVLAVTGLGRDLVDAAERAYRAASVVRFPGMHYRRDIAGRAIGRRIG